MFFLDIKTTNIYENLAMEEYIFNKFKEDIFVFWINEPSVVVGKHQNLLEEVNLKYCYENNIKVSRRISGGGTVYHDFGNLNYTYITKSTGDTGVDFKELLLPMKNSLNSIGVDVEVSKRNDLILNGYKVCGHSQFMRNKRVMHHGCILFNAELEHLSGSLKSAKFDIKSSSVKSVRSKVMNIKESIKKYMDICSFKEKLKIELFKLYPNSKEVTLTEEDLLQIKKIANDKYIKEEWIYGQSPKSVIEFDNNLILQVQDGKIVNFVGNNSIFKNLIDKYFSYYCFKNYENVIKFINNYY